MLTKMRTADFLGLDAATGVNVALATLTAPLTFATFWMAGRAKAQADAARDQAESTAQLVALARQDLAATATPHIVPIAPLGEVTGGRAYDQRTVGANLRIWVALMRSTSRRPWLSSTEVRS